ncbi:hypothetical protein [Actinotalea fermentans]|uniref:Uncharacterized protein n=1 Tax=Actinotalea fermentans TaxID=43671 RepID=A0A511YWV8_9CELL|nr:hypothetical protein [Actinotalea fermentans]GEN79690.1 hypothetical protein AFE02nite_14240 [Actinotalea fermentans]
MTAPTIGSAVLDHVRAYAAQVRAHLADLAPEQVEDLTDGLEADLAEALADEAAPVVTGETPVVGPGAGGGAGEAQVLDLTRRFGPAAAYAAELRASAGLGEPAGGGSRRPRLQGRAVARARRIAGGVRTAVEDSIRPALDTPAGRTAVGLAELCRPLWWVVRGWLWFVLVVRVLGVLRWGGVPPEVSVRDFVPASPLGWLVAGAAMLASLEVGRRRLARGTWSRRAALALSVAAVVSLPWAVSTVWGRVDGAGEAVQYVPYEVEVPVPAEPEDGVYVGGMLVSNLFVYDAAGNPLDRVQIFDDRGRPVRTTYDGGWQLWSLPGVAEPWRFVSATDADGRARWNVYPLQGAPGAAWDEDGAGPTLLEGEALRTPPPPFAKAPALGPADG